MSERGILIDYLESCNTAEEGFPIFLHAQVPRHLRMKNLEELRTKHRAYLCPENRVRYILDFAIAKELFANPRYAMRYTALMTDLESEKVDFIEKVLTYFPVFSDGDDYVAAHSYAAIVKANSERRIEEIDLYKFIEQDLDAVFDNCGREVDLLNAVTSLNARIALKALGWEHLVTEAELTASARQIFSMFGGQIAGLLDGPQIELIYRSLRRLAEDDLAMAVGEFERADPDAKAITSAVLGQWITGFLTPCVTWTCYTFLRRFDAQIFDKTENYGRDEQRADYRKGCLRDFIPFQSIHRMITRDCVIAGMQFRKGEFVCIIPDALGFSTDEYIVSAVIGAPSRPCMGMHISSKIVDAYESYFLKNEAKLSEWEIHYNLQPSVSVLEFSRLLMLRCAALKCSSAIGEC
jgi:hypothetical protein